ncbi:26S protease regulatory subunit 6A [Trichinella papuae]|uniref:26S protease regulatory subunit 6A n=1 Tax=Trichinella papuae TaxID=268474 RepID=A0A0V1M271_9BILA|nr:26S protease regulatory subunit 6A [Trichinella papuae]
MQEVVAQYTDEYNNGSCTVDPIPLSEYLKIKEKQIANMNKVELLKELKRTEAKHRLLKKELHALSNEYHEHQQTIKKIESELQQYKRLPFIVCTVSEILKANEVIGAEHITNTDKVDAAGEQNHDELIVVKAFSRLTLLLPNSGLIKPGILKVGDLVAISRDELKLVELLPSEYDPRIKGMELINQPNQQFCDIGGLDNQIQEMIEAVIYPITHKEYFEAFRVQPPKGVLMYGPPGTGKTLLARALASSAKCTFLKLSGTALLQRKIGEGAKMVREAFRLAKEKAPTVLFIDEIDSIGSKRHNSDSGSDREVHRTMLELLTQMDGFKVNENIRVIAATNRPDVLDPALTRSGRFDRKVELPLPNEKARLQIMQIYAQKMNVSPKVNFEELARCTDDFNGAQCKAVVTEAGMVALRENKVQITHEHFLAAILEDKEGCTMWTYLEVTVVISQKHHMESCPVDQYLATKWKRRPFKKTPSAKQITHILTIYDQEVTPH